MNDSLAWNEKPSTWPFNVKNHVGPGPEGAEHSWPHAEDPWLPLQSAEVEGIQQFAGSTL